MKKTVILGALAALALFASINFADESEPAVESTAVVESVIAPDSATAEEFAATVIQQEANVEVVQEIITEEVDKKKITECEATAAWHAAKIRSINSYSSLNQEQNRNPVNALASIFALNWMAAAASKAKAVQK